MLVVLPAGILLTDHLFLHLAQFNQLNSTHCPVGQS